MKEFKKKKKKQRQSIIILLIAEHYSEDPQTAAMGIIYINN